MKCSVSAGVDVGGTSVAVGLVSNTGEILEEPIEIPTPIGPDLVAAIAGLLQDAEDRSGLRASSIGVGPPGFLDHTKRVWLEAYNVASVSGIHVADELETALEDRDVILVNDAAAATWGEARVGSGFNRRRVVCLTVGTGLGGGVVLDDRLLSGVFEPGHITVVPNGRTCPCGRQGCLEAYVSGTALRNRAIALGYTWDESVDNTGRAAYPYNPGAVTALQECADVLGHALVTLNLLFGPECFIIGGGVSAMGEALLAPVREAYERHSLRLPGRNHPEIAAARLGNQAGIIGAALLST